MSGEIRFTVPLPPPSLRANSRAHWATKKRDADDYSEGIAWSMMSVRREGCPWKRAAVHYDWHYCGNQPDPGNIPGNVKYLQDIICCAPATMAGRDRYYLGIVENDKHITPTYAMTQEKRRAAQRVEVVITRIEEDG